MKRVFFLILPIILIFSSCEFTSQVKEQLSFLMEMSSQFGGTWNGSTGGDVYSIKITNSKRINDNPDSIDYYGTIIGRELINKFGVIKAFLELELVDENNFAVITKSSSDVHTFDLRIINRFIERDIGEYLLIKKSFDVMYYAENNQMEASAIRLKEIDSTENHPFVRLAKAHHKRANGFPEEADNAVDSLAKRYPSDDLLLEYIGFYYQSYNFPDKALKLFKQASRIDKNKTEHLFNIGMLFFELEQYDSGKYYFSRVINLDSVNIYAYCKKAYCNFYLDKEDAGCKDIRQLLQIAPEAYLPDSIFEKCNIEIN